MHSTIQDNANKKLPLTIQQKQNIIKMATASGYHPKDRIAYIRRDVDDNKFVWKAKTEADIEVIVDDAWVELNLMNPHCQWYNNTIAQQLTNEDINNPEKNRWVQLPVGDYLVIENEDETTITNKKAKIDLNVPEEDLYKFNYCQEVFGDVCTLINVINMLDYMKHNTIVAMLVPYMNIHLWHEYQNQNAPSKKHGYRISQVMQLLRRKCKYSHHKEETNNIMKMNKKLPFVFMTSPTHAIGIFDNWIFDANHSTVQKLTLNNLKKYNLGQVNTISEPNGKIECWIFYQRNMLTKK